MKLKVDFFRPEFLLVAYSLFMVLVALSYKFLLTDLNPGILGFIAVFSSFPFYLAGVKAGKVLHGKKIPKFIYYLFSAFILVFYTFVLKGFFFETFLYPFLICFSILTGYNLVGRLFFEKKSSPEKNLKLSFLSILGGILFLIITLFSFQGIPILNPALKKMAINNFFWGATIFLFFAGYTYLISRIKSRRNLFLLIIGSVLAFSVTAFRAPVLIILLTGTIAAYYSKKVKISHLLVALVSALLIILFIGSVASPQLSPSNVLLHRAGTTHYVFNELTQKSFAGGLFHGNFFLKGNPRLLFANEVMGYSADLTYTLLGAAILDFGLLGAFGWMFSLGLILSLAYQSMKSGVLKEFYPLLFSISLVWIEIGPDQFYLIFFFGFLLYYMQKYGNHKFTQLLKSYLSI